MTIKPNAITVAVRYSDYLEISLAANRPHFAESWVVTSTEDEKNVRPIAEKYDTQVYVTDVFYARGARFNKWAALEEGLDRMGRRGWLCLWDADTVFPSVAPMNLEKGFLYGPMRRIYDPVTLPLPPEWSWHRLPLHKNFMEWPGFAQVFHAEDSVLGVSPWHETDWVHCGGADSFFQQRWSRERKVRFPWEVLHMGPAGVNWCGRATDYLDGGAPAEAASNADALARYLRSRKRSGSKDGFKSERLN